MSVRSIHNINYTYMYQNKVRFHSVDGKRNLNNIGI